MIIHHGRWYDCSCACCVARCCGLRLSKRFICKLCITIALIVKTHCNNHPNNHAMSCFAALCCWQVWAYSCCCLGSPASRTSCRKACCSCCPRMRCCCGTSCTSSQRHNQLGRSHDPPAVSVRLLHHFRCTLRCHVSHVI